MSPAPLADDRPPGPAAPRPERAPREEPLLPPPFVRAPRLRSGDGGRGADDGGPLWLRLVVGADLAGRPELRSLGVWARLSLGWWRIGLTPTARRRRQRFREAVVDGRGSRFAVEYARRVG